MDTAFCSEGARDIVKDTAKRSSNVKNRPTSEGAIIVYINNVRGGGVNEKWR